MKNERLMDALGTVSPAFVSEAAPGNVPAKAKRPIRPVRLLIAASIIIATMMVSILGMTISAEEQNQLQEVPVLILQEDFERLIVEKIDEIDANENTPHEVRMRHKRLQAFYEQQFMLDTLSPKAKEAMLERFPITELGNVYNLDFTATDVDKKFVLDALRELGFTQDDLIDCYERMYQLVEESDSENKEKILASLPEIPKRPN